VIDELPAYRTVTFSGGYSGTTTTNSQGFFSIMVTANQLGPMMATTTDPAGHASNGAIYTLTSTAPVIQNFSVSELPNGWYEFTGQVTDESPQGLTVYFGGEPISLEGHSVTVAADGTFSFAIQLNGTSSDDGVATAVTTDWWGLQSNVAVCNVSQT
jgi:hypothetical protein